MKEPIFCILNEDRLMYNLDLTDTGKFESTVIGEEVLVTIFNEQYHHCYKTINEYNWPLLIRRLLN